MLFKLFLYLFLFQNISANTQNYEDELVHQAKFLNLSSNKQWHKLLHYQPRVFGGFKSQADGINFFLDKTNGKTSPESELEATIRAFFQPSVNEDVDKKIQHPQCQFPARYAWLKNVLKFDANSLKEQICERFQTFKKEINAHSVTVVFSSYYLNNPSSAFGHSLLRLNKSERSNTGRRFELLDYGISYAALLTTSNPIVYAVASLFGYFDGSLTSMPYYYKVREYNDFESRDIWEYDLNYTQEQVDRMVAHVWELGSTIFNYYYLDENCSYFVLTILEAGNPDVELTKKLPAIVIPADTIHALNETPGLVKEVKYRPALRVQFQKRFSELNIVQKKWFFEISKKQSKEILTTFKNNTEINEKAKADVLDAEMDYIDFKKGKELLEVDSASSKWKQDLLIARSQLAIRSEDQIISPPIAERPDQGHRSGRVGLELGQNNKTHGFTRLNLRFALHDLADPYFGFPEFSQIEFLNTKIKYAFLKKETTLEDFALIRVVSLSPISETQKQMSWKIKMGAKKIRDGSCTDCNQGELQLGGGYTFIPFQKIDLAVIPMADAEVGASKGFRKTFFRSGVGPSLGIRLSFSRTFNLYSSLSYKYYWPSNFQGSLETNTDLRIGLTKNSAFNIRFYSSKIEIEPAIGFFYYL